MKRIISLLVLPALFLSIFCLSCGQQTPDSDNVLPFGLEYEMSADDAYTILDSLSSIGEITYNEEYGYLYMITRNHILRILLGFNTDDQLGVVELTTSELPYTLSIKERYILSFFKSQGINLKSWEYSKPTEKKYKFIKHYSKDGHQLSYTTGNHNHITFEVYRLKAKVDDQLLKKRMIEFEKEQKEREEKWGGSSSTGSGKVSNSPWDGSVYQVKNYLKRTYSSYKSVSWSAVRYDKVADKYYVQHVFQVKNALGGISTLSKLFELDNNGKITNITDL